MEEIGDVSCSFDMLDWDTTMPCPTERKESECQSIFAECLNPNQAPAARALTKKRRIAKEYLSNPTAQKIDSAATMIAPKRKPLGGSAGGEVGGSVSWGGDKGVEFSAYGDAHVKDDSGNRANVHYEVDDRGRQTVGASGSFEKDFNQ